MYNEGVDIKSVIQRETGLKFIRNNYLEHCPFCGSGTGPKGTSAFRVYGNGYRCFSCEEVGDAIVFIERFRGIPKNTAIHIFKTEYKGEEDDYSPGNTFQPTTQKVRTQRKKRVKKQDKYDVLGLWDLDKFHEDFSEDPLIQFLYTKFPENEVNEVLDKYYVRTSSGGTIFPYLDSKEDVRTVKMVKYNADGKRDKSNPPFYLHKRLGGDNFKFKRCLFGEHLLNGYEGKVGIVESEKTAIIASLVMQDFLILSTGGKNLLHINNFINTYNFIFQEIVLFPDHDKPDKQGITPFDTWGYLAEELFGRGYDISVSDVLENKDIPFGWDIADLILNTPLRKVDKLDKVKSEPAPALNLEGNEVYQANDKLDKVDKVDKLDKVAPKPTPVLDRTLSNSIDEVDLHFIAAEQRKQATQDRQNRLDKAIEDLGNVSIPDYPIEMKPGTIEDIPHFINNHISMVESNIDNEIFEPYLLRLEQLVAKLKIDFS